MLDHLLLFPAFLLKNLLQLLIPHKKIQTPNPGMKALHQPPAWSVTPRLISPLLFSPPCSQMSPLACLALLPPHPWAPSFPCILSSAHTGPIFPSFLSITLFCLSQSDAVSIPTHVTSLPLPSPPAIQVHAHLSLDSPVRLEMALKTSFSKKSLALLSITGSSKPDDHFPRKVAKPNTRTLPNPRSQMLGVGGAGRTKDIMGFSIRQVPHTPR